MTTIENIIYYSITAVVFFSVVLCCVSFHNREQMMLSGEMNKEKRSMIEVLVPYAIVIGGIAALVTAAVTIFTKFRKTERERIDELKDVLLVILSKNGSYTIIDGTEDNEFRCLDSKYQAQKYAMLHQRAFDELKSEGKIKVIPDPRLPDPDSY